MGRKSKIEIDAQLSLEDLTLEIRKLSQIGKAINASAFNRKGLVLLLSEMSGVSRGNINTILNSLPNLEKEYLK